MSMSHALMALKSIPSEPLELTFAEDKGKTYIIFLKDEQAKQVNGGGSWFSPPWTEYKVNGENKWCICYENKAKAGVAMRMEPVGEPQPSSPEPEEETEPIEPLSSKPEPMTEPNPSAWEPSYSEPASGKATKKVSKEQTASSSSSRGRVTGKAGLLKICGCKKCKQTLKERGY